MRNARHGELILGHYAFSEAVAPVVAHLGAEGWAALHQALQADGAPDLNGVFILVGSPAVPNSAVLNRLCAGLKSLSSLTRFEVVAGEGVDRIDLHGLERPCQVLFSPRPGVMLTIPAGSQIVTQAKPFSSPGPRSVVQEIDAKGKAVGVARPVDDMLFVTPGGHPDVRLNGCAEFAAAAGAKPLNDPYVRCRHLVRMWLEGKAGACASWHTPEAISRAADSGAIEHAFFKQLEAGASSLFNWDRFGHAIAAEFEHMKAGETRSFAIATETHALAVRLEIASRSGCEKYVMTLYDPNATAMEVECSGSSIDVFRHQPKLDQYLSARQLSIYGSGDPRLAALFPHSPEASKLQAVKHDLAASDQISPKCLKWLLTVGDRKASDLALRGALAGPWTSALGEELQDGFARAMEHGPTDGPASVVLQHVLGAAGESLNKEQRFQLLQAGKDHKGKYQTALRGAFEAGRAACVADFARQVAHAPSAAFTPAHRRQLLLCTPAGDPGSVRPILFEMCEARTVLHHHPTLLPSQHEAIHGYLAEIVKSPLISEADKAILCRSEYQGRTAALSALQNGNPGAAAAMFCAVLSHAHGGSAATLTLAMQHEGRPSVREVFEALDEGQADQLAWKNTLQEFMRAPEPPAKRARTSASFPT